MENALAVFDGDVGDHPAALAVRGVREARVVGFELGAEGEHAARVAVQLADLRRVPWHCECAQVSRTSNTARLCVCS